MTSFLSGVAATLRRSSRDGWRISILCAIPVAICAYLVALWLERPSGQYSVFDHASYVIIACIFVGLEVLLLTRRWSTTGTVMAVIVMVYCQFVGKLIYLLYFNPQPSLTQAEFTETFFWIPALFVLSAFVPGLKRGRVVVVLFFALFSAISVGYIIPNWRAGRNFGIIYALIEMILANVTLLTLTHNFLGFKERLAKTSARAETMERLAYQDGLTDLPNRLALEQDLARLVRERPQNTKMAVAFVDIDDFKLINDTRGHATGDELLSGFAARLGRAKREGDLVFRISGDEFVVLFTNLSSDMNALVVGERICTVLAEPFEVDGYLLDISASVGVALCPDDGATAATLLKHADAAMYTVKHSGKNGVALYDASRDAFVEDRALLVSELQQAIREEQLELYYQPIINLETSRPVKVEALLRWHTPTRGHIPPVTFIALAEDHGLISHLGAYALKTACFQVENWAQQGLEAIVVSVNVSAQQLQDPNFVPLVKSCLQSSGIAPERLELELTESTVIHTLEQVTVTLQALRRLGVSVALDDFGTGY
ncbi:MAG: diguanylate cyclase/phosphodiesterase (GGDEF & EAL domains) with PAS/PAC sensor(s), partial [uncultured Chloroflexia bacterium]